MTKQDANARPTRRLLVVEPEALVRWSLSTYLRRWFDVTATDCRAEADRILDSIAVDAVVVSDDLPQRAGLGVARHALRSKPGTVVVRTFSGPIAGECVLEGAICLEKPFDLAVLAKHLGAPVELPPGAVPRRRRTAGAG